MGECDKFWCRSQESCFRSLWSTLLTTWHDARAVCRYSPIQLTTHTLTEGLAKGPWRGPGIHPQPRRESPACIRRRLLVLDRPHQHRQSRWQLLVSTPIPLGSVPIESSEILRWSDGTALNFVERDPGASRNIFHHESCVKIFDRETG